MTTRANPRAIISRQPLLAQPAGVGLPPQQICGIVVTSISRSTLLGSAVRGAAVAYWLVSLSGKTVARGGGGICIGDGHTINTAWKANM